MEKIDYRILYKHLYQPKPGKVEFLTIPPLKFLMIDGEGNPNTSPDYTDVVSALYTIAYTLKFKIKKTRSIDYNLLASEGLWWMDDMSFFTAEVKDQWKWTMMIAQPDLISDEDVSMARAEAARKKPNPALARMRFEIFDEGLLCPDHAHWPIFSGKTDHRHAASSHRRQWIQTPRDAS